MTKKNKGFTLIELLVVVAILGLLATIVAVSLTSARARARDSRRVSDLRQFELALELYHASQQQYPTAATSSGVSDGLYALISEGFLNMSHLPKDPSTGSLYCYAVGTDKTLAKPRQYYHVGAVLENNDSDLLDEDRDYSTSTASVEWDSTDASDDCSYHADGYIEADGTNQYGDDDTTPTYDRGIFPMQ